jgi:hypothetical protein
MSKAAKKVSDIDRLIELASDEKPAASETSHPLSTVTAKDEQPSMWRVLLQLRVLLPYLAKVLPMVERSLLGTNVTGIALGSRPAPNHNTAETLDRELASVCESQRDLIQGLKTQAAEIQFLQEQMAALNRLVEKDILVNEELAGNLAAFRKIVTTSVIVIASLLVVSIALNIFAIVSHR